MRKVWNNKKKKALFISIMDKTFRLLYSTALSFTDLLWWPLASVCQNVTDQKTPYNAMYYIMNMSRIRWKCHQ